MDDRQIRIWFQVFFSAVMLIIFCFTLDVKVAVFGFILAYVLGYAMPWFINLISSTCTSLIYGPHHSDISYVNQFYQDDMEKAQRLVREGQWDKAIVAYREIIQKAPRKIEPRYYLAKAYEKVGHLGLALGEFEKIVNLKEEFGPNHPYVLESARAVAELPTRLTNTSVKEPHNQFN